MKEWAAWEGGAVGVQRKKAKRVQVKMSVESQGPPNVVESWAQGLRQRQVQSPGTEGHI